MQHPELVSYYNGLQAKPYLVFIEFNKTYLTFYDEDMQYENAISVALKNCTISETDNILYVYINNTSSAYLAISKENSWYASLKTALKQNENTWFSKLQQQKWYTLLLILLLLAGSFYSLFTYVAPVIAMEFVSVKQEEAFGRNVYHSFVNEEKIDDTLS
jgi:hypothetical protein